MNNIVRIQPMQYVHLLDLNTNVTVLEVGPKSLILQDNHKLVEGPLPFVVIPPGHYCVIENPVKQSCEPGKQCDLKHGYREVRFFEEPFPLYPGETIEGAQQLAGSAFAVKSLLSDTSRNKVDTPYQRTPSLARRLICFFQTFQFEFDYARKQNRMAMHYVEIQISFKCSEWFF